MTWCRRLTLLAILCFASIGACGGAAMAAPVWNLDIHHNQTNFTPGGVGEYWFDVNNVGDTATSGAVTLTVNLSGGFKRDSVRILADDTVFPNEDEVKWSCPGSAGDTSVVCTTTTPIPRHTMSRNLVLTVDAPASPGVRFASAKLEGGGAAKAATAVEATQISSEPASFSILSETFLPDFFKADGLTLEREAGAHPELLTVPFDLSSVDNPTLANPARKAAAGNIRNLVVDLPPGFVGAPTAVAECSQAQFTLGKCPPSSQVGRFDASVDPYLPLYSMTQISAGVFNLSHPLGVVSDIAFQIAGNPIHIKASLDPANRYAIRTEVRDINESLPAFNQKLTIWGVPADPSHDAERCQEFSNFFGGDTSEKCSTDIERKPYLSLPSQCDSDNTFLLHSYDSWQETGSFGPEISRTMPGKMTRCERPRFEPEVEMVPTGKQANTPTGLDVHVKVAQNQSPDALATPPVKRVVVALPQGMSFSPSFADGLQSCSPSQIKLATNDPVECPDASRIGEVELSTPLLPKAAEGSMYLASQRDNPFHSLFALYLVLRDTEERGVLIKIPGKIDVDPVSGQITTTFEDTPQFPFDDLTLKFRSGPRAPLVNPSACGSHTIGVQVSSYAQPTEPVDVSNTYEIAEGPGGGPCPAGASSRPFTPELDAGTLNPRAGAYSPFHFRLSRDDREQELSRVTTVLPPGLVARIAGIPFCPEHALASISAAEGTARNELGNPACPSASQIGTIAAGLGAGPGPNYFAGKVYLAGPYRGAPLSMAVVTPGMAGPFDLGTVVVRAALEVDSRTAQVTATSDPFPTILHGVLLQVRDVRLRVDRAQTTINPTNCSPMLIEGRITGVGGSLLSDADDSLFTTSSPFQVGECASLGFKPKLTFRLFGGTKRGAHPKLRAVLRMPRGGANIKRASVALPRSEFLDQSHIGTVCTRVQYAQDACPPASVYGYAQAKSPLLDEPLSGPVYLRSSDNLLPDLVAALKGKIDVDVVGRVDSIRGGIRNTFDLVPDAPVETFTLTLQGGSKGLLINSTNLCKRTYRATARFAAQNGRAVTLRPPLLNSCKEARRKAARRTP